MPTIARRRGRRAVSVPRGAAAAALATALLIPAAPGHADPAGTAPAPPAPGDTATITLITGDRVHIGPDGTAAVLPAPGREDVGFVTTTGRDGATDLLVPVDALAGLAAGSLDERLFDVAALAANGYADAERLPLVEQDETGSRFFTLDTDDVGAYWSGLSDPASADRKLWLDDGTGRPGAVPDSPDDALPRAETFADGMTPVTVRFTTADGSHPTSAQLNLQNQATGNVYYARLTSDGVAVGAVPPGEYRTLGFQQVWPEAGETGFTSLTTGELTVGAEPVSLAVGGEDLVPLEFDVDRRDARLSGFEIKAQTNIGDTSTGMSFTIVQAGRWDVYSTPSGEENTAFAVRPTLTGPDGDYAYHLVFTSDDGIPEDLSWRVRDKDLAVQQAKYHSLGPDLPLLRNDYGRVDSQHDSAYVILLDRVTAPAQRTEYLTASPEVEWFQQAVFGDYPYDPHWLVHYAGTMTAGSERLDWGGGPLSSSLVPPALGYNLTREGDRILGVTPLLSPPGADTFGWGRSGVTGTSVLSKDGVEIARKTFRPESHSYWLPAGDSGTYTLSTSIDRDVPWTTLGTHASAEWTFRSSTVEGSAPIDMAAVRMNATGVRDGFAPRRVPQLVTLDVERQGADAYTTGLTMAVSYDGGATWRDVPLLRLGEHALTMLAHPAGATSVSVRFTVADSAGNTLSSETIRSYGLE